MQAVKAMNSGESELCAAYMAVQQAIGTESMARELGVHLDAMELQVGANTAIGIVGRQGLGNLRHIDLSYLWLQAAVRGKQVDPKKLQSESNMVDLGTKALEKEQIGRHMKNLECVQFDQKSLGLTVEGGGERTPYCDCVTRSTLPASSTTRPALVH